MAQSKPKMHGMRSNRHRAKITSNAGQSRISKNFIYSKRDVNDLFYIIINAAAIGLSVAGCYFTPVNLFQTLKKTIWTQ
jgi:hypothetical protein